MTRMLNPNHRVLRCIYHIFLCLVQTPPSDETAKYPNTQKKMWYVLRIHGGDDVNRNGPWLKGIRKFTACDGTWMEIAIAKQFTMPPTIRVFSEKGSDTSKTLRCNRNHKPYQLVDQKTQESEPSNTKTNNFFIKQQQNIFNWNNKPTLFSPNKLLSVRCLLHLFHVISAFEES